MLFLILILTFIVFLVIKHFEKIIHMLKLIIWASRIPGPLSIPPLGGAYRFFCKREDILNRIKGILKDFPTPIIKLWLGPKLVLLIRSPLHLEKILQSTKMVEKDSLMDVAKPYIGEGLITGSGPKWKAHRKLIMPTLSTKSVESYCEIFHRHAAILVEKLAESKGVQIKLEDFLHPCAIDIVCETVMDIQLNAQQSLNHEFMDAVYMMYFVIIERIVKPWLRPDFLFDFSPLSIKHKRTLRILRSFISDIIQRKQDKKQAEIMKKLIKTKTDDSDAEQTDDDVEDPKKIKTTIEQLVNASLDNTLEITEEEMIDEMLTMFMASSDTIASITCFCLKMLAMHPHYQEQVIKEFEEKLELYERPLDSSICAELAFLERCIKETIRLFPIAPFIVRINNEDFKLDDQITIPKGVSVMMALFDVHRNPQYWKRPEEFYPDHFLQNQIETRPQYAYLPFSSGLRVCVGKQYAMISIKIMVVKVLQKLQLSCRDSKETVKDLQLTTDISIRALRGNRVIVSHRKAK